MYSIVIIPYAPENPYQNLFIQELRRHGHDLHTATLLKELCGQIRRKIVRPNIIHLHWIYSGQEAKALTALRRTIALIWRVFWLRWKKIKIIWTVHNLIPHECQRPRLEYVKRYIVSRLTDRVLVHSELARELIVRQWHLQPSKIGVVPHPHYIDVYPDEVTRQEAERQLHLDGDKMRFLFMGAIRSYKQVPFLIKAFRKLPYPQAELLIAGKINPDEPSLSIQIRDSIQGDQRVIVREGFVTKTDMQCYMHAADVVVFPYRDTLSSGAAILAMSFGKACIVPRAISFNSILDDHGGIFYEGSCQDSLSEALDKAIQERDRLKTMGQYNKQKISSVSPAFCTEQLLKQYEQVSTGC